MSQADLSRLLAGTGPILLDFDGPVCSIFAGIPAPSVAARLRRFLSAEGELMPDGSESMEDPLEVLQWAGINSSSDLVMRVDDVLRGAELDAAASARPTPYARDFLLAAQRAERRVAIVSNNSKPAIEAYLVRQTLNTLVTSVIGRVHGKPEWMKPHPRPLHAACSSLGAEASQCVFIGDSHADIMASVATGVPFIGYGNDPGKTELLLRGGARWVVKSMADLARVLEPDEGKSHG